MAESKMYVCPMHPSVRQAGPGQWPTCGMALLPEGTRFALFRSPRSRLGPRAEARSQIHDFSSPGQSVKRACQLKAFPGRPRLRRRRGCEMRNPPAQGRKEARQQMTPAGRCEVLSRRAGSPRGWRACRGIFRLIEGGRLPTFRSIERRRHPACCQMQPGCSAVRWRTGRIGVRDARFGLSGAVVALQRAVRRDQLHISAK